MRQVTKFDLSTIPLFKIAVIASSPPNYSMDRVIFVEHFPDYGNYMVIQGDHCSCYGFDDTTWEASIFDHDDERTNLEELRALLAGWDKSGYGSEKKAVRPILEQISPE